jgi:hypothetical protein
VWEEAGPFDSGIARVRKDGLQGLIDRKGKLIVPARHEFLRDPKEGLAAFESEGKVGFYNSQGKVAVEAELDLAEDFSNGAAKAIQGGKAGLMGPDGEWLVEPNKDDVGELGRDGLYAFREGRNWGYLQLDGKAAIKAKFQSAGQFAEGLAPAAEGGRFGYISPDGAWAIAPQFDQASPFVEGRARVALGQERWLIDSKGRRKGKAWRRIGEISEGLVFAATADESGYINMDGAMAVPVKADDGLPFRNGLAQISSGGSISYIDREGRIAWSAE